MKAIDFHGLTTQELEVEVDHLIGQARLKGREEGYTLITGEGVLKQHLKKYLSETYGLTPSELHNASGTVWVLVE